MTALTERLIGHRPRAYLRGMPGGKEYHAFQQRLALGARGIRIDQRVEIA
jgi:hypothetical protein